MDEQQADEVYVYVEGQFQKIFEYIEGQFKYVAVYSEIKAEHLNWHIKTTIRVDIGATDYVISRVTEDLLDRNIDEILIMVNSLVYTLKRALCGAVFSNPDPPTEIEW